MLQDLLYTRIFVKTELKEAKAQLSNKTITSKLKAFIERLYAISTDDKYPQKDFVLLMTAGDDNDTTFEQPKRYFHLLNQALGWNEVSVYCAGGCTGCEELARQIGKEHLENAYQMGLNL